MKKVIKITVLIIIITTILFICSNEEGNNNFLVEEHVTQNNQDKKDKATIHEINLQDINGKGTNYSFNYQGTKFSAIYSKDNWRIVDSYKIRNEKDMAIICQALIDIHPIHGKDKVSYRTVEDLVYEWVQHNVAYDLIPDTNKWKNHAKDVDLNPEDQDRNLIEIIKSRIDEIKK